MSRPGSPRSGNTPHFVLHDPPISAPMGGTSGRTECRRCLDVGQCIRRVAPMDIFHIILAVGLVSCLIYIYKQARDKN